MAVTKAFDDFHDWNAVAQNTIEESSELDMSANYVTGLIIQAALDTTTAHTGTGFIVLVNPNPSDDEDWGILSGSKFTGLIGTAVTEPISNNPLAAGASICTVADTAGYETYGDGIDEIPGWRFIKDGTLVNSELIYQILFVTDTSISWAGVNKNAHVQNTPLWNIALSKTIQIPAWVNRAKVICNNTYDADGSTLNFRVLAGEVTGV